MELDQAEVTSVIRMGNSAVRNRPTAWSSMAGSAEHDPKEKGMK